MNKQFKIFNGSAWTAVKFPAFDSEKLGGKLPSAFSEVGHSHAFSTITGRPDTIAGYGITDAYTKLQIDSLLNSKLGATANAASATKLLNARTLTIGSTGKTFDGTSNASWSLTEIGAAAASHTHTFASLTSKPDTVSGYGITNAYTKTEIDGKTWLKSNTDNRGVATTPDDYNAKFDVKGLKTNSVIGITDGGTYSALLGIRGWGDSSGGEAHELAFDSSGRIMHRSGSTTAWGNWKSLIESDDSRLTDARTPLAHNQAWSTITNTPTTIANYGITDAYTKTQIDTWFAGKENAFTQLSVGKGGTGRSTLTAGSVLVGNGTTSVLMLDRSGIDTRTVFPTNAANVTTGGTAGNILIVGSDGKMTHTAGIAASKITSEVLGTARLGTGTASSSTWLRGDGTWQALPASANNYLSSIVNSKNGSQQTLYFSRVGLTDVSTIITGATTSEAGLITTGAQTFAGTKTFNSDLVVEGTIQAATKTIYHAGGSFTLNTATHTNAFLVKNTTFDIIVYIPTNAAQAFPVGTEIHFYARNVGKITFTPNSGVTLQSIDNKRILSKRYGTVTLKKIYADEWTLFGAID